MIAGKSNSPNVTRREKSWEKKVMQQLFGATRDFDPRKKKKVPTLFIVFHPPPSRDSATIRTRDGPKSHSYRCHQSRDAPTNRTFTSSLPTPPAATVTTTNNSST